MEEVVLEHLRSLSSGAVEVVRLQELLVVVEVVVQGISFLSMGEVGVELELEVFFE
jgi:hypothetical protein